jgi:hypothetical protein
MTILFLVKVVTARIPLQQLKKAARFRVRYLGCDRGELLW